MPHKQFYTIALVHPLDSYYRVTVFENQRKSLIQHCQKWFILASFGKLEACGQTVLSDRSVLIGQKLVENAKIIKLKCDILSNFQTMWVCTEQ